MKVRGPTRQVTKLLGSLGATPVGMPLPQIPDALSQGHDRRLRDPVGGGAVGQGARARPSIHTEFDPTLPALYTTTFVMAMNKAKYEVAAARPEEGDRRQLAASRPRAGSARCSRATTTRAARACEGRSNQVHRFSKDDYEQFKKVSSKVDEAWVKEMDGKGFKGQELLDGAKALIKKHTK